VYRKKRNSVISNSRKLSLTQHKNLGDRLIANVHVSSHFSHLSPQRLYFVHRERDRQTDGLTFSGRRGTAQSSGGDVAALLHSAILFVKRRVGQAWRRRPMSLLTNAIS